jgi:hypothetical protein
MPKFNINPALTLLGQIILTVATLSFSLSAGADPAGESLARSLYDRPDGKDATSLLTMSLTEKGREPRLRQMVTFRLDLKPGNVATLIRFTAPADIEGTGLLTLDFANKDSNQWIYLPALDRVRRVDSNRKAGRFVNSDYYYEDLRTRTVEKDEHRIIGSEVIGGVNCEILESTPVDADNSVYIKRLTWVDSSTMLPMRIDFFEKRADQPSKRWLMLKKARVKGFWTVMDSSLTTLANGHQTRLTVEQILYDRRLPASLFTTQTLADESAEEDFRP